MGPAQPPQGVWQLARPENGPGRKTYEGFAELVRALLDREQMIQLWRQQRTYSMARNYVETRVTSAINLK
jgi:hypothetical protein